MLAGARVFGAAQQTVAVILGGEITVDVDNLLGPYLKIFVETVDMT
jgi:hypothetical protein